MKSKRRIIRLSYLHIQTSLASVAQKKMAPAGKVAFTALGDTRLRVSSTSAGAHYCRVHPGLELPRRKAKDFVRHLLRRCTQKTAMRSASQDSSNAVTMLWIPKLRVSTIVAVALIILTTASWITLRHRGSPEIFTHFATEQPDLPIEQKPFWTTEQLQPRFAYVQYATDLDYLCNAVRNSSPLNGLD